MKIGTIEIDWLARLQQQRLQQQQQSSTAAFAQQRADYKGGIVRVKRRRARLANPATGRTRTGTPAHVRRWREEGDLALMRAANDAGLVVVTVADSKAFALGGAERLAYRAAQRRARRARG
jgi:hypothetical protein